MTRGQASGYTLTNRDAATVLGMAARGDRDHDIAAWFGVNQGRIAEVKSGSYGSISAASPETLPPKGPPGIKGKRLRAAVGKVLAILAEKGDAGAAEAVSLLREAQEKYDASET